MEVHEIIDRLKKGMFNDEARSVAEAVLRARGIDPTRPVVPPDEQLKTAAQRPWKPRLLPALFATFAGGMAGRQIGSAFAGAFGAGIAAAALAWLGWWIGVKLAFQIRKVQSAPMRFMLGAVAVFVWLFAIGIVGLLVQAGSGRIRP